MSAAKKLPFDLIPSDGYSTLKLSGKLEADESKVFVTKFNEFIQQPPRNIVINCEEVSELSGHWLRALMQLHIKLKGFNKELRLIAVNERLGKDIKKEGLSSSLKMAPNLRAALVEFGLVTPKALDVNFINPFLDATLKVLSMQASTQAKAGQIYKKEPNEKFSGDISGVIGLVSEAFSGSVVISFPAATFLKVMSRMLGEEFTEITKDIEDGAGELTNIIFGQAKVILNEKGYGIKTAIPSVVSGRDHSIQQMTNGPRMVIPFETDAGPFFVEICASS